MRVFHVCRSLPLAKDAGRALHGASGLGLSFYPINSPPLISTQRRLFRSEDHRQTLDFHWILVTILRRSLV
jgi:hypothetical protein